MKYTVFILLILSLCGCYRKKARMKTGLEGKPMPSIALLATDSSTIYNTVNINPGRPTLLFSLETWCPFCKAQTQSIISHIMLLKDINIYMICNTQFSEFKKFANRYELNRYPNIKAGVDYNMSFERYFKSTKIPFLAIYDREKKLKQIIIGKTAISTIRGIAFN